MFGVRRWAFALRAEGFPVTLLLDQLSPSETFIRRESEQLRCRGWPIDTRYVKGGAGALAFSLPTVPWPSDGAGPQLRERGAFDVERTTGQLDVFSLQAAQTAQN
ncbi:MAG: hypothetical protein WCK89_17155 [bacterium]